MTKHEELTTLEKLQFWGIVGIFAVLGLGLVLVVM